MNKRTKSQRSMLNDLDTLRSVTGKNIVREQEALSTDFRVGSRTLGTSDASTFYGGKEGSSFLTSDPVRDSYLGPPASWAGRKREIMTTVIEWQPFVTINHGYGEIIQHESQWLDTKGCKHAILDILTTQVSATYIYIETSESLDGPWLEVTSIGPANLGSSLVVISRDLPRSDSSRLRRYLRWRSGDAQKEFTLRIVVQLKQQ